ncbi:MAG: phosphoenolpyruvate synthase [Deltaproteobacteria bacterium]|nr:phosphoenolpyruvate synthase [Deltaproteobacteria bacterium]
MHPPPRRVESISARRASAYGGKARSVAALARAGFRVPAAWALPTASADAFFASALSAEDRVVALLSAPASTLSEERLATIAARVRSAPLPPALERSLRRVVRDLLEHGASSLAIRSSSSEEDQDAASAAGLHATFLNVLTEDAALEAVRACWASLFAFRALAYLRSVGARDAGIGVLIQAMVPADASGVMFSMNPLTGDDGEVVIDATLGLGCAVADGRVSPDTLRIEKGTRARRDFVLGDKQLRVVCDPAGGVREEPVPEEARTRCALSDDAIERLVDLACRVENHFEGPRDVEWALVGSELYVLQARPITAVAVGTSSPRRANGGPGRDTLVWSNVNVGEALPGVATPLTWSVLSGFSELGFRRAFASIGLSVPKDAELVGSFRGRIFLNLTELLSILSQVPWLRPRTLLALGGGGQVERLELDVPSRSSARFLLRLPLTAARFARESASLTARVERFEESFESERNRLRELDLRLLPPLGLERVMRDAERLLDEAGAVLLSAYGNLLLSVVALGAALKLFAGDEAVALGRDLSTGIADLESAAPGLALWHIAQTCRTDAEAREFILGQEPGALRIRDLPAGKTRRALERFLAAYGRRGPREGEIAAPRWEEDPTLLFVTLKLHLGRDAAGARPVDAERRQRAIREQAERRLTELLPWAARGPVRNLLALAQRFLRLRERLRAHVTEVLGLFRRVALDASRRLAALEPEAGPDAAFYLTQGELHAVLRGELTRVAPRVRRRRRQVDRDRALPDPPGTFVGYPPELAEPVSSEGAELSGIGASGGVVEGRARVLRDPSGVAAFREGEVLVVPCADVGWSPLFLVACAVVTDLGGPLSHAAIVLREYGVPSVVNVVDGTRRIRTGDLLRVDGDRGRVLRLEAAPDPVDTHDEP